MNNTLTTNPKLVSAHYQRGIATSFVIAISLHIVAWVVLPLLFQNNIALDMAEGLAWGKEWQLGYEKDPPLFPWVIHTLTIWSGKSLWISYLAGQLCVATVFFSVWQLGKRIVSEQDALLGALILEGVYYFNLPTLEFNDILLQMPFAALFGWLLHKSIVENRLRDWFWTGVVASLGLWSRYSMGAYILPLAVFALMHPSSRRRLYSAGPWLMMATAVILFLPHLYWIVDSDFISIKYVGNRAPELPFFEFVQDFMSFIGAQLLALLPMLALAALLWRWQTTRNYLQIHWKQFDVAYLTVLALGPFVFSLALSLVSLRPLRTMWGASLWLFIGLFIVMLIKPVLTAQRARNFARAWIAVFLLPIAYYLVEINYATDITGNEQPVNFPGELLARNVTAQWHAATKMPLKYVAGDLWTVSNVAFYGEDSPSTIFSHGDLSVSSWIDESEVKRAGMVLIWDTHEEGMSIPAKLAKRFPDAVFQGFILAEGKLPHQFGLAFVMPK